MSDHDHDHHDHHHDHDHSELSETELRVRALETILTEKGYVDPAALDAIIQAYETKIGPHNGAQVVAKAWTDPAFRQALLDDASAAVSTLGHVSRVGDHLVAVENTPQRHNMVVCTLCSCYPLGNAGAASGLVQGRALSVPRGEGSARRAGRFRRQPAEGNRDPGLGFDRRDALPGAADAARGHRGMERAAARRTGDARLHDRHRIPENAGSAIDERRARHGRHGRFRQGRARAERADVPYRVGSARAGDGAGDGRRRRIQHRYVALLSRDAAAARLSQRVHITRNGCSGSKTCWSTRASSPPRKSRPATRCSRPKPLKRGKFALDDVERVMVRGKFGRAGTGAREVQARRSRAREEHSPGDPHAAAALCARPCRRGRARSRLSRVSGHGRDGSRREPAMALHRRVRRAPNCGARMPIRP